MSDDAKYSPNEVATFNHADHDESPVLELSRQNIRQRSSIVKIFFGLFMLVTVIACVLMAITGHWFFAGLCFLLGMWLLFHLDRTFGPFIRYKCPHCVKNNELALSSTSIVSNSVGKTTCPHCKKEIRYRLVE